MPETPRSDEDVQTVMVPRYTKPLAPVAPERVRRLRRHLVKAMREARGLKWDASPRPPPPSDFAALVASTACGLCEGWCCRHGGDDAYLDGHAMAGIRRDTPDLDGGALLSLYTKRVPPVAYEDSCIFHGAKGCTLDRSLRAEICNSYFCGGLAAYFRDGDESSPTVVHAGKGEDVRSSQVLGLGKSLPVGPWAP